MAIKPDVGSLVNVGAVENCFHGDFVHAEGGTGESCTNYRDTVELSHSLNPTILPYPTVETGKNNVYW